MSDVMYGPKVRHDGQLRQTNLIAFLDDATRMISFATFAFSEGAIAYLVVLEQAIRRRGIPKRLYVDNGAAFRSRRLALVCAKLGIALIHAKPYKQQGKAKVEAGVLIAQRWILARLRHHTFFSLDELNARIAELVDDLNARTMRVYRESRRQLFERI